MRAWLLLCSVTLGGALGCAINTGVDGRGGCANGSNNAVNKLGECQCSQGYSWCDVENVGDLNCCANETFEACASGSNNHLVESNDSTLCVCENGYDWCDPSALYDLECCVSGDGDGDGDGDCIEESAPNPLDCDSGARGALWCTNSARVGVCGSKLYVCTDGIWSLANEVLQAECDLQGADFAYGCIGSGSDFEAVCGMGPGQDCTADQALACLSSDLIAVCESGKTTQQSCSEFCATQGDGKGNTFPSGECRNNGSGGAHCYCCEEGLAGCAP